VRVEIPEGAVILCATERLPELAAIVPINPAATAVVPSQIPPPVEGVAKDTDLRPLIPSPEPLPRRERGFPVDREHALREIVRNRLECLGLWSGPRTSPAR